jgi:hypothetical protein
MPFLLGVEHRSDGTTRLEYDISPTQRVQVLTLTSAFHMTLDVPAEQLLAPTLTEIRPPANRRRAR